MAGVVSDRRADRLLDLDRSTGGDDGSRQQRDHVAGSRSQRARGRDGSAGAHRTAGGRGTAAGGRTAARAATQSQQFREHPGRPERRRKRGKLTAHASHLGTELAAAPAIPHVTPGHAARADASVVRQDQFLADLRAGDISRLAGLRQAHPCPHQQRLDGGNRDAERAGQVGVGHPPELAHQERRALLVGKPLDVGDQAPKRVALLHLGGGILRRRMEAIHHLGRGARRAAKLIDAAVVCDAVQPRPQCELAVVGAQAGVGTNEYLLQRILGVLGRAGEHLARVREQSLAVPIMDDPERLLVPRAKQRYELLVRTKAQKRRADRDPSPRQAY
jgi:hypothetical protein